MLVFGDAAEKGKLAAFCHFNDAGTKGNIISAGVNDNIKFRKIFFVLLVNLNRILFFSI